VSARPGVPRRSPANPPAAGHTAAANDFARAPEIIRLEDATRLYKVGDTEVHALDGVSFTVHRGEFVALMGPSGSGKSTLLNILGCLDSPTSGRYALDGEMVQGLSEDRLAEIRRTRIGFIFQSYHLVARMSAARNVELPMILAGIDPAERAERVRRGIASVGLAARADHRPDQLSGGERQRVAIARAMVMSPHVLLADEPTGNLDTKTGDEIVALLERLNREGLTIVLVTHDPGVAEHAGRLIRLRDGKVVSDQAQVASAASATRSAP